MALEGILTVFWPGLNIFFSSQSLINTRFGRGRDAALAGATAPCPDEPGRCSQIISAISPFVSIEKYNMERAA